MKAAVWICAIVGSWVFVIAVFFVSYQLLLWLAHR